MKALTPWAAWIGGAAGWALTHQLGSDLTQYDCRRADPGLMLVIGLLGASIILAGAAWSWPVWRARANIAHPYAGSRRFIAGTGELAAGLFLLAIIFQTVASFIVPQCHG